MKRFKTKMFGSTLLAGALLVTSALPSVADASSAVTTEPATFELSATKAVKVARVTGPTLEGETVPNPNQTHVNYAIGRHGLLLDDYGRE